MGTASAALPVVDVAPLVSGLGDVGAVADAIDEACRQHGFFYIVGHGVDEGLQERLEEQARALFALPDEAKERVAMRQGGAAWRGWFPLGGELTSGVPDGKEGFYLGAELAPSDPRVAAGTPLHGPNLFPAELPELRPVVLEYLAAMTQLGHALMRGFALALGLPAGWFDDHLTADPLVLFRMFRYPPGAEAASRWGVAEHTDYGLLTMLRQDRTGGLEVHAPSGWIEASPLPRSFVCNIGDMLERMTGGLYRSTPHRVRNTSADDRLSFPFFFDPGWDAEVLPVPLADPGDEADPRERWDGEDVLAFEGTYGDYLTRKVGRVFPDLQAEVIPGSPDTG
jgi:isopenicillin N synthase-like dioxygenase